MGGGSAGALNPAFTPPGHAGAMPAPAPPHPPTVTGPPTPAQPLRGLTVLLVEDSRFAADALRLSLGALGARLRRAETLAAAHRHLAAYRADLVIVDMGLPDGRGCDLIRALSGATAPRPLVLGTSGDPATATAARAAGAAHFLPKPLPGPAGLRRALAPHLPGRAGLLMAAAGGRSAQPDPQTLRDDLLRALALLDAPGPADAAADFVAGLARSAQDDDLGRLAGALRSPADAAARPALQKAIGARLARLPPPFAQH